jgi:flagellar export protein FliJ
MLDQNQREFAAAQARAARMERALISLDARRREGQEQIRAAVVGEISRTNLLRMRSYDNALWLQLLAGGRRLVDLRGEAECRRTAMVESRRRVRAMELLRDKSLKRWQVESDREERKFLDDLRLHQGLLGSPAAAGGDA